MLARLICWLFDHRPDLTAWERLPRFMSSYCSGTRWYRTCECSRCGKLLYQQRTHRDRRPLDIA